MGMEFYGLRFISFIEMLLRCYGFFLTVFAVRTTLNIFGIGFFGFGKNIDSLIQDDLFAVQMEAAYYGNDLNKLDEMPKVDYYLKPGQNLELNREDRQIF